jgi:tetratricopeptide (TPR) repeat protein
MTYFSEQQFDSAAAALGHLPKTDRSALMAEFYRGLAFFYTGHYDEAETAFGFIATQLPLPEVVNNEGVAAARRGHDAGALFQQAIQGDPHDPDYQFNLAVALARRGDRPNALAALGQALKLRPEDSEAQAFQTLLRRPEPPTGSAPAQNAAGREGAGASQPPSLPLERIKRSYNDASFRQAASEMEEMEAQRLAALPGPEQAAALARNGSAYLNRGLMLEAEREFQLALAANPDDADAHAGLAEVRRRSGDDAQARAEAETSLRLRPNAAAWLTLARLDRWQHHIPAERDDIEHALALDPANSDARGLERSLPPATSAPAGPRP